MELGFYDQSGKGVVKEEVMGISRNGKRDGEVP